MARYNKRPSGLIVPSVIVSTPSPTARTGNNAPGFVRDPKSELFLLGVANFVGTDTFYEKGKVRDQRFQALVHHVAHQDPDWLSRFLIWLRNESNMRTASVIGAVEFCRAYKVPALASGLGQMSQNKGLPRHTMDQVLQRADEPGEAIGYHLSMYGRGMPKSMKRGIADAAARLYGEYNTLKYDTDSHAIRFGDVLELCHAKPGVPYQVALFKHLIDRRHKRDEQVTSLPTLLANASLRGAVADGKYAPLLEPELLRAAGMTWEDALSLAGNKVSKKELWQALIPTMGYMALLRNLRNFSEAGIDTTVAAVVAERLANAAEVARSRQLPMRFLSAYRAAASNLQWAWPLEQALQLSLRSVPALTGRTLILIDQSPSMFPGFGFSTPNKSDVTLADQAKIFGMALALRAEKADVIQYGGTSDPVRFEKSESLLKTLDLFRQIDSTDTAGTVRRWWNNMYDRMVILTDEQANFHRYADVFAPVPANKLAITFNLGGYAVGHAPSGSAYRVTIGGLSDSAFKLLPILEQRAAGQWPF